MWNIFDNSYRFLLRRNWERPEGESKIQHDQAKHGL